MTQYIDKDAIVAEIDRIQNTTMDKNKNFTSSYDEGKFDALTLLENYIDTLETKEVDLEKEIANQYEANYEEYLTYEEFADIAKHFFELSIKAKEE